MDINKIFIGGNLTRDVMLKTTTTNKTVAKFPIANHRTYKDATGSKREETIFVNVVAWGNIGNVCGKHLKKGDKVLVEGRLITREFEKQDGEKVKMHEINADAIHFLNRKKYQENAEATENETSKVPPDLF